MQEVLQGDIRPATPIYSSDKRHACNVCQKTFVWSSDFIRHQRIHTDERPFQRIHTDERTFQRIHLGRHESFHAGQGPYKCPHCDYRSLGRATLQSHVLFWHTRNFKHVCPHCEKRYPRARSLEAHIEFKHFDTESYREIVKRRLIQKRNAGIEPFERHSIFVENVLTRMEEDDSGTVPEPKRAQLLPPFKIKYRKEIPSNPLLKYPRVVGNGNIQSTEGLRKYFFEKFKTENCIKKESPYNGENGDHDPDNAVMKDLKISVLIRKERYLEATQMQNLNVFGDFRKM